MGVATRARRTQTTTPSSTALHEKASFDTFGSSVRRQATPATSAIRLAQVDSSGQLAGDDIDKPSTDAAGASAHESFRSRLLQSESA